MLGMPNEHPKLEVTNSRRTRRCTRPPTASASRSFLAPSLRFRRRVSLVVVLLRADVSADAKYFVAEM